MIGAKAAVTINSSKTGPGMRAERACRLFGRSAASCCLPDASEAAARTGACRSVWRVESRIALGLVAAYVRMVYSRWGQGRHARFAHRKQPHCASRGPDSRRYGADAVDPAAHADAAPHVCGACSVFLASQIRYRRDAKRGFRQNCPSGQMTEGRAEQGCYLVVRRVVVLASLPA